MEFNEYIHKKNITWMRRILSYYDNPIIWAAWGTLIEIRDFLIDCLYEIFEECKNFNARWVRFGNLTKKGHPRHPLYLRFDSKIYEFEINKYISEAI
jgi:hypothetical protein